MMTMTTTTMKLMIIDFDNHNAFTVAIYTNIGGIPILMETLIRRSWFRKARWVHIPLQATLVGAA